MKGKCSVGRIISVVGMLILCIGLLCNSFGLISVTMFRFIVLVGIIVNLIALYVILKRKEF